MYIKKKVYYVGRSTTIYGRIWRRKIYNVYEGVKYIDVRVLWLTPDKVLCPKKTGVNMTFSMFKLLLQNSEKIQRVLQGEDSEDVKYHIGRNVYLSARREKTLIDLRRWQSQRSSALSTTRNGEVDYLDDEHDEEATLVPTTKGLSFTPDAWEKLVALREYVEENISGFRETVPCCETHHNQLDHLECGECNPNSYFKY